MVKFSLKRKPNRGKKVAKVVAVAALAGAAVIAAKKISRSIRGKKTTKKQGSGAEVKSKTLKITGGKKKVAKKKTTKKKTTKKKATKKKKTKKKR